MISPLVTLNSSNVVMVHREGKHTFDPGVFAPGSWSEGVSAAADQAGHWILQPVASAGPAAFSPGTGFFTVNMLSGSPCGGWASPTNTVLISSWSPARNAGAPGCRAIS